ncbi:MAG TPA: hypothetical protein VNS46_17605 [Nocardioides sp.]|nr:hypothetical protein [Nocardioides sp.]
MRNRKRFRRSSFGFYVPADIDGSNVEQRILEASVVLPPTCAITGWSALRWLRDGWFTGLDPGGDQLPVDLLISTVDVKEQPGFVVCGEGTGPDNIIRVDGVPITVPAWSVAFMMRRARTLRDAVRALDMAAYSDLVSIAEAAEVIEGQSSWTGVPQAREALAHADENTWSPQETTMRLHWRASVEGACPRGNVPLFDLQGRHLGTPDLVDVCAGVAADYDGAVHLPRDQRRADRTRDEVFAEHGIQMVRWLSGDRPGDFVARLHRALGRAARRSGPRTWTAEPPSWWTSTTTVAARRALTEEQRPRLLRYRIA